MKIKKISLFVSIILFSIFFNINECKAEEYNYTFSKKYWTYEKLISKHVADLCTIGSTSSTCKANGNTGSCYGSCTITMNNPNYDKKLNPTVPKTLKVPVKFDNNKLTASKAVEGLETTNINTLIQNDKWTKLVLKIPSKGRLGESEIYLTSVGVCPTLTSEMIKDGEYVEDKIKNLKYPTSKNLADICKKGGLVAGVEIAEDIDTKYNDDGTKKDTTDDVDWPVIEADVDILGKAGEIPTCEELLGDDLIDIIQTIVNIARVMVPIGLIVFGIMDFGKAIFLSNEEDMKKSQSAFVKRLIIAVAFFLIPVVIKVLLGLANDIWGNIATDLCGIKF
jgi:hypothetical protein